MDASLEDTPLPRGQPVDHVFAKRVFLFSRGELIAVSEDDHNWDSFDGRGLDIGKPAQEFLPVEHVGSAHHEVEGERAVEAGVDDVVAGVSTEIPEVDGDLLRLKAEEIGPAVFPLCHLVRGDDC